LTGDEIIIDHRVIAAVPADSISPMLQANECDRLQSKTRFVVTLESAFNKRKLIMSFLFSPTGTAIIGLSNAASNNAFRSSSGRSPMRCTRSERFLSIPHLSSRSIKETTSCRFFFPLPGPPFLSSLRSSRG
jgi:hypothetical protein